MPSARPFTHHGQRITAGPVHDRYSPWWTIGVGGAVLLAVCWVVALATWIAIGCGLPVGEHRR